MNDPLFTRLHILTLTATLAVICVFVTFPGLDLTITRLFYAGAGQFLLDGNALAIGLNDTLRIGLTVGFVAVFLTLLLWRFLRITPASGIGNWSFAAVNFLLGPGLIVNGILKARVGRARPAHLAEFGGDKHFTPMLEISDQCARNCSFSSGEVAQTATFVFVALALLWPHLSPRKRWIGGIAGAALTGLSMVLRIGLGRHFMSDALTSVALSALVALATYRLCKVAQERPKLTPAALKCDLKATGTALRHAFHGRRPCDPCFGPGDGKADNLAPRDCERNIVERLDSAERR
ncbi:phosphatase PAP2 family protein [Paenirhodobacter sp.]|uniref:phosphatase PAP2 family protein n=1 Tax=Paenirhodobacter sp. TaxID=1965326 RepID=UPI003B3FF6CB